MKRTRVFKRFKAFKKVSEGVANLLHPRHPATVVTEKNDARNGHAFERAFTRAIHLSRITSLIIVFVLYIRRSMACSKIADLFLMERIIIDSEAWVYEDDIQISE